MALKPTIYKLRLNLADMNNNHYDCLTLTVAQHPSETLERMMVRVLARCLHAHTKDQNQAELEFTSGLSTPEEPDLWQKSLDDRLLLWVDVGEPLGERVKKASRRAERVSVYSFNSKSAVWWKQEGPAIVEVGASVSSFEWEQVQSLAGLIDRTAELSVSISESSIYVASDADECELSLHKLHPNE